MIRVLVAAVLALALLPAAASAHPLGNFSVNHLARGLGVGGPRRRPLHPRRGRDPDVPAARASPTRSCCARKQAEVAERLVLTVDGARVALRPAGDGSISHPEGVGRPEDDARRAAAHARAVAGPRRVELRDGTFPGRVGWKAIVVRAGRAAPRCAPSAAGRRPHRRPAPLSRGPALEPVRRAHRDARRAARRRHGRRREGDRRDGGAPGAARTGSRRRSPTRPPAAACCSSCCSPRSPGAPSTRSRRATARRWSPPTWSARAGRRGMRSRSARRSR